MRRILLLFVSFLSVCIAKAQSGNDAEANAALQLVSLNRAAIGLSADDLNNLKVSSTYRITGTDIRMVYLQQTYKDIPVYNQMQVLAFKNGKLVSNAGGRISAMDQLANRKDGTPSLSAEVAVQAALASKKLTSTGMFVPLDVKDNGRKIVYGDLGVATQNVTAELTWVPMENKKEVRLAWEVYVVSKSTPDYWLMRVDAVDSKVISENNLTVYDQWNKSASDLPQEKAADFALVEKFKRGLNNIFRTSTDNSPNLVTTVNYMVIPYPAESPIHPGGTAVVKTNPWTLAGGNAVSLGWHNDGTLDYTITRGNNVFAHEDRANNNCNCGLPATSTTSPDPLNFIYPGQPDYTVAPTTANFQQFAITNLFYWNNILHDITYKYGFDEPGGNFQNNNQGRGGLGNDYVQADAQDGGGTNNANFATPVDGSNPRMQMYLFTLTSPQRDGDIDNGVITHEYFHGVSNRLTGGPANSSCLNNAEEGGEGWSDYNALMLTTDWSTAVASDGFNKTRPIGNYVLGNAPNASPGIRNYPYCTNFAINPLTYANMGVAPIGTEVHNIGEIWCAALWEMTWEMIQLDGINPNLFNNGGTGGNSAAYKLVIEGMRLQPCSPGYIDARDAILKADTLFFAHHYSCAIITAFARRGMGIGASEGSPFSATDQTPSFVGAGATLTLLQNGITHQAEGTVINYSNKLVTSSCGAIANFKITDTLPSNVTFSSANNGGTYNAGNRVVSWTVNQAAATTVNYNFAVSINAGAYYPPVNIINEPVAGATIPASWTENSTTTTHWVVSNAQSHSAPNSFFSADIASVSDQTLATTNSFAMPASPPQLSFWHFYNSESTFDGGVVEISTNGGGSWSDIGAANFVSNGYNGTISSAFSSPIAGRQAFTGNSGGFIQSKVNLTPYAGQPNVKLRWRFASDVSVGATGWYLDDITLQDIAHVDMRSNLFNASGVRQSFSDSIMLIDPPAGCIPPTVGTQPSNVTTCVTTNASFTVVANGTTPITYQWQESQTGAGGPWNNLNNVGVYSGVTTTTLTLTGVTLAMNGYQYRCVITGQCAPTATSNPAVLTVVNTSVGGTTAPANTNVCSTPNSGTITLSGQTGNIIRWEFSTAGVGGPYTAIANTTNTLNWTNVAVTTWYRAVVQSPGCATANSSVATVTVVAGNLTIITDNGTTLCQGDPTLMTVVTAPTLLTFANPANLPVPGVGTSGPANPYPSIIAVSGVPVNTPVQSVTLFNISHTWESDMGFVLQSPTNQNVVLMNAINGTENGGFGILNRTYTFSDAAATGLNLAGPTNVSGTYKCSNNNTGTNWPAPGPGTVGGGTNPTLATFTGDPTGNWKLFAYDFAGGDFGNVAGGWNIVFAVPGGPVSGGTFSWAPPTGLNATNTNPVAASPNTTTTYTVTHNNGTGCIRTASITITIKQRPLVTAQPVSVTNCSGTSASFTVAGTGTGLTYQWQESTNGGTTYTNLNNAPPYSGVNTATLTINPVTVAMNNYRYRCVLGGDCPPPINNPAQNVSAAAVLNVNALPNVTVTPTGPICGGVAGINGLALNASGANTYVWSPLAGLYTDATASTAYTGTNLATVYAAPTTLTSYTVTGTSTATGCSATASVLVNYTPPAPTVTPNPVTMCLGDPAVKLKSSSSTSTTQQFCSGTISVPVPDNNPAGAVSNLVVSGVPTNCPVTAMSVTWNMPHTWDGDMVFALKAPNGQILNLDYYLSNTGGAGATTGFVNTTVSSTGVNALSSGANPYTGTFKADAVITGANGSGGPTGYTPTTTTWSSLYSTPNGTYTLAMYDGGAGDVGTLTSWCLNITTTCGVPSTPATWSPAGGLFSDAGATTPYVAGTQVDSVWTRPSPGGVYNYQVTVNSLPPAPAVPATNFANNNGFSIVTFNFVNTNSYPVTITDLSSVASVAGASLASVYTKPGAINGSPGAISAANGWTLAAGPTPVTATGAVQPMLTGLNIPVAGGATISMAFQLTTSGGTFNLAYSTIAAGNYVFSSGGCNIVTGTNIGYAGDVAPNVPTFTPRGFIGSVTAKATFPPCTSPARTVIVTVNTPIALNPNLPVNAVVCTDKTATFSVAVTAGTSPTYQWQVSTNGGTTFTNVSNGGVYSGATTPTLTITAPPVAMNGYQYRCIVTGTAPCGSVTSAVRTLTVNPLPTVVITAPYYNLLPGLQPTITSTSNPVAATYTWIRNGAVLTGTSLGIVSGINTGSLQINIDGMGTYSLRVTDVNGCTNTSNAIIIGDSTSGRVFIYPNPNSGQFQVRYNPTHNNVTPRGINVYNAMGQRITNLKYTLGLPFSRMDVDLRPYGAGVYWIEVVDVNDQRLAVGRAEVLR